MLTFDEASPDIYKLLKVYAHENRMNMTLAESILWENIRQKKTGHKFLRQYIIGDHIVDFICRDCGLIIEVDGAYHSEPKQIHDDALREQWLTKQGYHIIRFTNEDILYELNNVLETIQAYFI